MLLPVLLMREGVLGSGSGGGFGRFMEDVIELVLATLLLPLFPTVPLPLVFEGRGTLIEDGSNCGGAGRGVFLLLMMVRLFKN